VFGSVQPPNHTHTHHTHTHTYYIYIYIYIYIYFKAKKITWSRLEQFNPLNAELHPISHLLALLGTHPILHVSKIRVKSANSHTEGRDQLWSRSANQNTVCNAAKSQLSTTYQDPTNKKGRKLFEVLSYIQFYYSMKNSQESKVTFILQTRTMCILFLIFKTNCLNIDKRNGRNMSQFNIE